MRDGCCHFAHLSVLSFSKLYLYPTIGNGFTHADRRIPWDDYRLWIQQSWLAGEAAVILNSDRAFAESSEGGTIGRALDLNPVGSLMDVLWV